MRKETRIKQQIIGAHKHFELRLFTNYSDDGNIAHVLEGVMNRALGGVNTWLRVWYLTPERYQKPCVHVVSCVSSKHNNNWEIVVRSSLFGK